VAGNVVRKKTLENIDYNLADSMATELWIKRGPADGAKIAVRDFELKDQKIDTQKCKILDAKKSLVNGVEVKFYDVETVSNHDQITVVSKHDAEGKLLEGKIGGLFELRAETEAEAKNAEYSKDLFVMGMAKIDKKLGDLRDVKELVLEVDGPVKVFSDGPRQAIVKDGGKTLLKVGKKYGSNDKATKADETEYLKETNAYDLSHPKIKALAAKAVGDAVTPEDKVKNISRFVSKYVKGEMTGVLPTIHDLIERKRGDCKSFALLFCTLARANGIPAREVSGLMYCGDDIKAFGGHAWNEVILNGVWVPVDASLNETEVNATHLCLGSEKIAAKNMLESLGGLRLKVVELQVKGR
jgi:transglutaminase/protease-like cytokinesis protein 3